MILLAKAQNLLSKVQKKHLIIAYICLLFLGNVYVTKVLNQHLVDVKDFTEDTKEVKEIKPAKVTLVIEYLSGGTQNYVAEMKNTDTVYDLLDRLRRDAGFKYEKVSYSYGTELDNINGIAAQDNYSWKIYFNNVDITYVASDFDLFENSVYTLRLVKE